MTCWRASLSANEAPHWVFLEQALHCTAGQRPTLLHVACRGQCAATMPYPTCASLFQLHSLKRSCNSKNKVLSLAGS